MGIAAWPLFFRNINAYDPDLPPEFTACRLRVSSPLHRISGGLMFLLMPFIIWMFDTPCPSGVSFARFRAPSKRPWFCSGCLFFKAGGAGLIWAYLSAHFCAGLRHLWMDVTPRRQQRVRQSSAVIDAGRELA